MSAVTTSMASSAEVITWVISFSDEDNIISSVCRRGDLGGIPPRFHSCIHAILHWWFLSSAARNLVVPNMLVDLFSRGVGHLHCFLATTFSRRPLWIASFIYLFKILQPSGLLPCDIGKSYLHRILWVHCSLLGSRTWSVITSPTC